MDCRKSAKRYLSPNLISLPEDDTQGTRSYHQVAYKFTKGPYRVVPLHEDVLRQIHHDRAEYGKVNESCLKGLEYLKCHL